MNLNGPYDLGPLENLDWTHILTPKLIYCALHGHKPRFLFLTLLPIRLPRDTKTALKNSQGHFGPSPTLFLAEIFRVRSSMSKLHI